MTIDGVTALERSYEELAKITANLDAEQLELPTCCPDWDVRGVLNHILGGALMYTSVNAGQAAGEDAGDVAGDDPVGAVARIADTNIALRGCPTPSRAIAPIPSVPSRPSRGSSSMWARSHSTRGTSRRRQGRTRASIPRSRRSSTTSTCRCRWTISAPTACTAPRSPFPSPLRCRIGSWASSAGSRR